MKMAPSAAIPLSLSFLFLFLHLADSQPFSPVDPQDPNSEIKCGSCPCSNPCVKQFPPPPPPPPPPNCKPALPPPPPPPRFIYTALSPPPPPRFIYTTGVPGNLYQIDANNRWYYFSGTTRNRPATAVLVVALGCGALNLMAFGKW
ncbi:leucine-rich repeat extensin-like protein 3 [Cucurbita pepo subsp. pepo]|uniref:leucine-rich repeat extensin-like protein 3 n=1 Tax=Cucurbita pepo subsp. pepo TaxID=3664 RepID=UPI000C9D7E01|nr:leucine-rich repeat extensin-like protein 3 [Cucurbita pepo subsp. pepo]